MSRGIFLVANFKSEGFCENLIYSIRKSGCTLPIRLIHFGGKPIKSRFILGQVEPLYLEQFPAEGRQLVKDLSTVLTDCPEGFLYRYLAWFTDWDEFLYSDNDIVALANWERMFEYLGDNDLVHADEEYTTNGKYNYEKPDQIKKMFGPEALQTAVTAGHFLVRKRAKMIDDFQTAIQWMKQNPFIARKHDQALLHIASLLGGWKMLNLCKPPYNWLSSWAGDYKNALQVIQKMQNNNTQISHIHYSGGTPTGNRAIDEFLFSKHSDRERMKRLLRIGIGYLGELHEMKRQGVRLKRFILRQFV